MWAGNTVLTSIEIVDKLSRRLTFTFSNGQGKTDIVSDLFSNVTLESIKRYVSDRERQLDGIDAVAELEGQVIDTLPPARDEDLQAFIQKVQIKKKMEAAIAAGDKKNTDQDYVDIVAAVKSALSQHPDWIAYYS